MTTTIKALSLRQPWAYAVIYLNKRLENRSWNTKFRGSFLIHAALGATKDDRDSYEHLLWMGGHIPNLMPREKLLAIPKFEDLQRGGIVGYAEVVDTITSVTPALLAAGQQPWFFGPRALVLENVRPLNFTPCRGQLSFFDPGVKIDFEEALSE
jgi:hypothetical protein